MPGRHRHPGPRAPGQVQREARVRRDLLRVHRRGGARAPGRARPALDGGGHRPGGPARQRRGRGPLEGGRARPDPGADHARRARGHGPAPGPVPGPRAGEGAGPPIPRRVRAGAGRRDPGVGLPAHHQCRPHGGHPARVGDQPPLRRGRAGRRHHLVDLHRFGRPELRCLRALGRDHAPLR